MNSKEGILHQTLDALNKSGVILYPTQTVWGLGCLVSNQKAYEKISIIKQRPPDKPYILLVSSWEMLLEYVPNISLQDDVKIMALSNEPTTIIYPNTSLPKHCCAIDGSVAIRITKHPFCNDLINEINEPIVSTSANTSGLSTPTNFKMLEESIIETVDFVVPASVGEGNGQSSRLFRLLPEGSFTQIR